MPRPEEAEGIDLTAPSAPGTYYYGACVDAVPDESDTTNNCSPGIAFVVPAVTSTDATLSGLSLSGVNFGTFASGTTAYSAQVANSVSQTTVTPTVNHSGASYVIKLGSVTDADGVIPLAVGSNVITIEVTAEDDTTTRTYTLTVSRLVSLQQKATDASLSGLTLSDVNFGTFSSATTSYSAQVANSVTQTTVTAEVNDSDASRIIKLGGVPIQTASPWPWAATSSPLRSRHVFRHGHARGNTGLSAGPGRPLRVHLQNQPFVYGDHPPLLPFRRLDHHGWRHRGRHGRRGAVLPRPEEA